MPVFSLNGVHILYIHVPKTGGTSIEELFRRNDFSISYLDRNGSKPMLNPIRRCSPQHMCREQFSTVFDLTKFNYIFMTVRNPYKRLLSSYTMTPANASKPELFDKWLFSSMEKMTANPYSLDNHIRPQADFFVPNAEIFKLEDGYENEWVSTISDRIGLKFKKPKMGHAMVSKKHSKESYAMSERAKNKIRSVYAMDFTTFNYSM